MTEHEQGQQPWTDEQIEQVASDASTDYTEADGDWFYNACFAMSRNTAEELLHKMNDAWQADHDALTAKLKFTVDMMNMHFKIGEELGAEVDAMQAKLDAAQQRIAELEGQLQSANESYMDELQERNPYLYDALRKESEADDE